MKNKTTIQSILLMAALLLAGLLLTAALPTNPTGPGVPADSTVSQLGAVTTAAGTDVLYIVSGGNSRKISWSSLMSIIRDSLEARGYSTAGDWSFDGATFDAGSAGKVIFNDSTVANAGFYMNGTINRSRSIYPFTNNVSDIGSTSPSYTRYARVAARFIYADQFILTNPSSPSTDTVFFSYDGNKITLSASLSFSDSAGNNVGSDEVPVDSIYGQGFVGQNHLAIIAGANEGKSSPPAILADGILIKPVGLHYQQTYNTSGTTRSLTLNSEVVIINASAVSGQIDTLYIDDALVTNLGVPIITIYNRSSNAIQITDTGGAGFKYCIRGNGNIALGQYDIVRLFYDANFEQWIVMSTYAND